MTNKIYELIPTYTQNQKSFYGKAKVMIGTDGTEILYSYDTPIISRSTDGTLKRLYNGYTTTTGKHIKAFCGLNKQDFFSIVNRGGNNMNAQQKQAVIRAYVENTTGDTLIELYNR